MGIFSGIERFHEAGQGTDENNVSEYGEPHHSLFTSTKVLSLHHDIEITDNSGSVVYRARTKFPSLHDKTDITTASGEQVAHIESKLFSLHERHYVTMADGVSFELSNELMHLVKDITNIEGLGWQLRGNIVGLNFQLYDRDDSVIAVMSQKMLSLHDKYCVDIYRPEYEPAVVAILVALQHIMSDRADSSSSYSSSSGS